MGEVMGKSIDLSIVIPVYNEEDNVTLLHQEIVAVLNELDISYEVIFVDDGSTDQTAARLLSIQQQDSGVSLIKLRRNFGQTAALVAGFDYASGDIIIPMDGDLQNDPNDIPHLLEKIEQYDVVSGWRKDRKDNSWSRKIPSKIANKLISFVTGVKLNDYGCTLKAYRKEVLQEVKLYGEMHRFIPAIASSIGVDYCEIPVHHRKRRFGSSKYGISRTIRVLLDLLTVKFMLSFRTRPIHVFGTMGVGIGAIGFLICSYLTVLKLGFGESIRDRPLLLLGILMIILGSFLIVQGLLGEIIVRTYHESQNKPIYYVKEVKSNTDNEDTHP